MNQQDPEDNFQVTKGFKSYVSKPEITDLAPNYLVKGSKNVLVDYANRIISRLGYTLFGAAAADGTSGIKGSFDWDTSTAKSFALRSWGKSLEFYWNGAWNTLSNNLATPRIQFAKIWDNTEKIDVLLYVFGTAATTKWSGGVTKLRDTPTTTTLRKQGVLTSVTTIGFVAGTPGSIAATITDTDANFLNAGFVAGDTLYVSGSTNNSRNFTIGSVTADTLTLIITDIVTTEAAGTAVTLHTGEPTWAASRFLASTSGRSFHYNGLDYSYSGGEATDTLTGVSATTGTALGVVTMTVATPAVASFVAHGLVAGDAIRFSTTGALPTGVSASLTYYVIAAGITADTFEFSTTFGGTAVNTTGSQSGVHTLTRLTLITTPTIGDPVWQNVIETTNPSSIATGFKQDLIGVQLNSLILASSKSLEVYISASPDYTNFTLTSPRAPGDPAKVNMDNFPTCIIPVDNSQQTASSLLFGAGTSEFFKLSYGLSQDNANELVRMIKLKTAIGSGLISGSAIGNIKNLTAYITREPSLDTIDDVEKLDNKNNLPLSDPIKDDFDAYDFTDAHLKYWKRAIYVALPVEGIVLIYDLMRGLWQPPQTMPISRFAIIDDELYGHSSTDAQTFKLFDGTNDNGNYISFVARFAYNNGGRRDRIKTMSEYWTDGYISANGLLQMNQRFGYNGYLGAKQLFIDGTDTDITSPIDSDPLGSDPLGSDPLGGGSSGDESDPSSLRFYQVDTMAALNYIEQFVEYTMDSLDGRFAIVAHGSNQVDAGTAHISHKK